MEIDIATQDMAGTSDSTIAVRAEALFTSDVSSESSPAEGVVAAAIRRAILVHGARWCAGEVAAAYGDHPETAAARMRWARRLVEEIYVPSAVRV